MLLAAGLAAVIVAVTRPEAPAPAAPTGTVDDSSPAYEPDTVPVVESLPNPLEGNTNGTEVPSDGPNDEIEASAEPNEPGFTRLALRDPPEGYELGEAFSLGGGCGCGMARYVTDAHTTELQLIVRASTDWFATVRDLGRQTWDVGGRTVYSDGELDGCLVDVCSIGVQWDEHTAISLMWVEPNGGTLAPGSDQASLLDFVPALVESPDVWREERPEDHVADEGVDGGTPLLAPSAFQDEDVEYTGTVFTGPPGTKTAVLRAPDGSMQIIRMIPNASGSTSPGAGRDRRSFGDTEIEADMSGQIPVYAIKDPCWFVEIADGGGIDADVPWRSAITQLFDTMRTEPSWVSFTLPTGWRLLTLTDPAAVHEVILTVPTFDGETTVDLIQAPGSGAAFHTGTAVRDLERGPVPRRQCVARHRHFGSGGDDRHVGARRLELQRSGHRARH